MSSAVHLSGQSDRILHIYQKNAGPIWDIALSPDMQCLAVATGRGLYLYDTQTLTLQHSLALGHAFARVAFAPNGQYLASQYSSGSHGGQAMVWKTADWSMLRWSTGSDVASIAFSPDSTRLALGLGWTEKSILVKPLFSTREQVESTQSARKVLAKAAAQSQPPISDDLLDEASTRLRQPLVSHDALLLAGHTARVLDVAFSPDGAWLASGAEDHTARLWDLASGREVHCLTGHTGTANGVAFTPDGQSLITSSVDGTVRLWECATGLELHRFEHDTGVWTVAVSADGHWLAAGAHDGSVTVWDIRTRRARAHLQGHTGIASRVLFMPTQSTLISAARDETVRFWQIS